MAANENPLLNPLILHSILLHLPQRDLLLSQRVCHTWREVIQRSHSLQESLFFRSVPEDPTDPSVPIRMNPLLATHFPAFFPLPDARITDARNSDLSPFASTPWFRFATAATAADDAPDAGTRALAYRRAEASWRRMLPCQPAPAELQLVRQEHAMGGTAGTFRALGFRWGAGEGGGDGVPRAAEAIANPLRRSGRFSGRRTGVERGLAPTFGLMYDVLQDCGFPATSGGRMNRGVGMEIVGAGERGGTATATATGEGESEWRRRKMERYESALAGREYRGKGRVVLHATSVRQCDRTGVELGGVHYPKDFMRSDGSVIGEGKGVKWTVEQHFHIRNH